MVLPTPNLDDRKFQDIVSEARSKIPLYCPRWTDYNLSDPGITLIELFAWMTETLLYRLNRVPDKNYVKFMEMVGIKLEPPQPACVDVTFLLSAPQPGAVTIPRGTEVATVRTETQDAISFTTDSDFTMVLPTLDTAFAAAADSSFTDITSALRNPDRLVSVFQETPQENDAFYLGFGQDLASHALLLTIQSTISGIGVNPQDPPWIWEYWDGEYEKWSPARLESDTTGGLNKNGQVLVHLPAGSTMKEIEGHLATWVRCRSVKPRPGQSGYSSSPNVRSILAETIGGTIPCSQSFRVKGEILGHSKGLPGQSFQLQSAPVISREKEETIEVETEEEGVFEKWQEVPDFSESGPDDRHFTLDGITGQVRFGPFLKQPTGEERQYGKVPAKGRQIRFTSYRSGGGIIGNVGEKTITVLKSSIPYIDTVKNMEKAKGGVDAESLELAKQRVPHVLRSNTRAVTKEDFEYLAVRASERIARAACFSPGDAAFAERMAAGTVLVLLVPKVAPCEGYISPEQLQLTGKIKEEVAAYLDERKLLGTRLELDAPDYTYAAIEVHVRAGRGYQKQAAEDIERMLYRYINPVCGGADGRGWPFGRSLNPSEILACLQGVPNVEYIEEVRIYPVDPATGETGDAVRKLDIPQTGLLCSHHHRVVLVD